MKIISTICALSAMIVSLTSCEMIPNIESNTEDIRFAKKESSVLVSNDEWDTVLLNCDNQYFVVEKIIETYNSLNYEVGIMDKDNNWICKPSSSNSLAKFIANESGKTTITGQTTSVGCNNFYYLGSGVVVASLGVNVKTENGNRISVGNNFPIVRSGLCCYFYNIEKNTSFYHNANSISTVIDGYIIINSEKWTRITVTGENEINFIAKFGPYSDGLFLGAPDSSWNDDKYGFYDINGVLHIDLSSYNLQDVANTKFVNGYCEIKFKNPAGNTYYATIDKVGHCIVNPHK